MWLAKCVWQADSARSVGEAAVPELDDRDSCDFLFYPKPTLWGIVSIHVSI